jgi:hypothetical protein
MFSHPPIKQNTASGFSGSLRLNDFSRYHLFFSFRGGFNGLLPGFALFSGFKLKHTLIFMGRIPRCLRRYVNNNSNEDTPLLAAGSFIRGFSEHVQEEPVRETNLKIRGVIGEVADLMIFLSETSLLIERRKRNASIRYFAQLISANIHGLHGASVSLIPT